MGPGFSWVVECLLSKFRVLESALSAGKIISQEKLRYQLNLAWGGGDFRIIMVLTFAFS